MELISYSLDFVSYLLQNLKKEEISKIKSIILFGSVAIGKADKESDIDIFIDSPDKKIEKEVKEIIHSFYNSSKLKNYWNLLNIKNEINVIVGQLDNWKLKDSMLGNAIILYQKYTPKLEEGKNKVILSWSNIKPDSKRVMLNKKISGYSHYGKKYPGLLEKYNGAKIGSNVIIIDTEHLNFFLDTFHSFSIGVKIKRLFEYNI